MVAKAPLVCVTKNRVNKGLREMLLSQLSTVQTDHHKPTYWFFFSLFLHGLPERLLLCLKNKMKQPPKKPNQKKTQKKTPPNKQTNQPPNPPKSIYPCSDNRSTAEHSDVQCRYWQTSPALFWPPSGVCHVSAGCWAVSEGQRPLTQPADYSEYLNTEVKGWSGNSLLWQSWSSPALC